MEVVATLKMPIPMRELGKLLGAIDRAYSENGTRKVFFREENGFAIFERKSSSLKE